MVWGRECVHNGHHGILSPCDYCHRRFPFDSLFFAHGSVQGHFSTSSKRISKPTTCSKVATSASSSKRITNPASKPSSSVSVFTFGTTHRSPRRRMRRVSDRGRVPCTCGCGRGIIWAFGRYVRRPGMLQANTQQHLLLQHRSHIYNHMRGIGTCNLHVWNPVSVSSSASIANSTIQLPSILNVCNPYDGKRMQSLCWKQRCTIHDPSGRQCSIRVHLAPQLGNQTRDLEYENGIDGDLRHVQV